MKNIIKLFAISILLMAFQCDDELSIYETYEFNTFKINISPKTNFKINDTIWIDGIISSNVYNKQLNDSIFYEHGFSPNISLYKLFKPKDDEIINCKDAIDKFEIINNGFKISYLGRCENSTFSPTAKLKLNDKFYAFRVGIKALKKGDYIISFWADSKIENKELNEFILNDYRLTDKNTMIGFDTCGQTSYTDWGNERPNHYFFNIE